MVDDIQTEPVIEIAIVPAQPANAYFKHGRPRKRSALRQSTSLYLELTKDLRVPAAECNQD
jgi:hypothetical protein